MRYKWDIYRNLATGGYSVINRATGRVAFRADHILAHGCALVVQKAGRLRAIREKRKNVHAFVRCERVEFIDETQARKITNKHGENRITYSPFGADGFVRISMRGTKRPATDARHVVLTTSGRGVELGRKFLCGSH